jgi:hypothetical protein
MKKQVSPLTIVKLENTGIVALAQSLKEAGFFRAGKATTASV